MPSETWSPKFKNERCDSQAIITYLCIRQRRRRPFWATTFLRRFHQICLELDHQIFTSMDFATVFFLHSKFISLASNPQRGGPDLCTHVSKWQGGPVTPLDIRFPFHHLLLLIGLHWRYFNPPPHRVYYCIIYYKITYMKQLTCLLYRTCLFRNLYNQVKKEGEEGETKGQKRTKLLHSFNPPISDI
jgi:hypothetical protein